MAGLSALPWACPPSLMLVLCSLAIFRSYAIFFLHRRLHS